MHISLLTLCLFFIAAGTALAQAGNTVGQAADVPAPLHRGYVQDYAGLLSTDAADRLESALARLEAESKAEVAVVTMETAPVTPRESAELFLNGWEIGAPDGKGTVLLVSFRDGQAAIAVGPGLADVVTAEAVTAILDTHVTPRLESSDYEGAALAGAMALADLIQTGRVPAVDVSGPIGWHLSWVQVVMVALMIFILGLIIVRSRPH